MNHPRNPPSKNPPKNGFANLLIAILANLRLLMLTFPCEQVEIAAVFNFYYLDILLKLRWDCTSKYI